jgi:hypothetical protein
MAARRIFAFGLINQDAWVQFDNYHFVVGENAIYIHDGAVVQRPDDNFIEKQFFGELNNPDRVFVARDEFRHEIIVYYPTGDSVYPNRFLTYNWLEKTWSFMTVSVEVRRMTYGVGPAPSTTWNELVRAWSQINETWAELARTDRSTKMLMLRGRSVDVMGITYTRSEDSVTLAGVSDSDTGNSSAVGSDTPFLPRKFAVARTTKSSFGMIEADVPRNITSASSVCQTQREPVPKAATLPNIRVQSESDAVLPPLMPARLVNCI